MALLSDAELDAGLAALPDWQRDGDAITRTFDRDDFVGAVGFVNLLLPIAEGMNHHPDLSISWSKVEVTISTHSEGGLTAADLELAGKLDAL